MAPETGTALLVLVAFVLPGFVALLISERTHVVPRNRTPFELLLVATYYSVICWIIIGLASWPLCITRGDVERMWRNESLGKLAAIAVFAVMVIPALVSTFGRLWRRSETLRPLILKKLRIHEGHAIPTAWDDLFRRRRPAMVRAVLTDGRILGGYYGSNSFPGYGEQSQDLLLEERWTLDEDDWFVERAPGSLGLLLSAGTIVSLELYEPAYEPAEEATPSPPAEEAGGA